MPASRDDAARELECLITIGAAAGKIAHEINNPLGSIHNAFLLVKDAIPPSHPHFRYVATIERDIRRIASATQRFAASYQPSHDQASGIALSAIVAEAVQLASAFRGTDPARIVVENRVHERFIAPAGLLRHALEHLLDAALAGLPADRSLRVMTRVAQDSFTVTIDAPGASCPHPDTLDYPQRLVAALGGTLGGSALGGDPPLFAVSVPIDRHRLERR